MEEFFRELGKMQEQALLQAKLIQAELKQKPFIKMATEIGIIYIPQN